MIMQYPTGLEFAFGETTVSAARREFIHRGKRVKLGNRAFDLLLLLLEQRGAVVSKDQIMAVVWARRVVGENTLEGQMSILRRALGSDRSAIKTIAGRGYQFVGTLQAECTTAGAASKEAGAIDSHRRSARLPVHVSPLIGRQTELAEVTDLLRSRRLVTLIGAGGVGKTRLAIEAARAVSECFDDGVFLAELAAMPSGDYVLSAIAAALGFLPGEGTEKNLEILTPALRDRHFLLVIDNCEHLVDSAARVVETLLQIAPGATLLTTSRESLRVAGEYVYRVPSLDIPSEDNEECAYEFGAVQLLRERIGSRCLEVEDSAAIAAMVRICRRLDGIPLAIELAAACTPAVGLRGVAEGLNNRFQLLRHGARTALPRQQTLRAAVDWSYELLPEVGKTVLMRLSMFADAFTLESARKMISNPEIQPHAVTNAIVELVDKSLLFPIFGAFPVRYRLPETIREYARERLLESGSYREWSVSHARHVLQIFRGAEKQKLATTLDEPDWHRAYDPYFADLRAAIAWGFSPDGDPQTAVELTVASVAPSTRTGLLEECISRADAAIAILPSLTDRCSRANRDRWLMKLHAARGTCLLFQGVGSQTREAFVVALKLAEHSGDIDYQLRALWGIWSCAHLNGKGAEALSMASHFAKVASQSPWAMDRMVAQRMAAIAHLCLGELGLAHELLEHLQTQEMGDTPAERIRFLFDERMLVQAGLSQALSLLGRCDDARREAERSLDYARGLGHASSICYALSEALCPIALLGGDNPRLQEAVDALCDASRCHGGAAWTVRAEMWRGLLALRAGHPDAYECIIAPALSAIGNARYSIVLIPFLAETAILLAQHGKADCANVLIDRAAEWAKRTHSALALPELQRARAEMLVCARASADLAQAKYMLLGSIDISRQRGFVAWASRGSDSLDRLVKRTAEVETAPPSSPLLSGP